MVVDQPFHQWSYNKQEFFHCKFIQATYKFWQNRRARCPSFPLHLEISRPIFIPMQLPNMTLISFKRGHSICDTLYLFRICWNFRSCLPGQFSSSLVLLCFQRLLLLKIVVTSGKCEDTLLNWANFFFFCQTQWEPLQTFDVIILFWPPDFSPLGKPFFF